MGLTSADHLILFQTYTYMTLQEVSPGAGVHGVFCMGWGVRIRSYASVLLPAAWTAQQHRVGQEHVNTYDNSFIHSSFKTS